MVGFVKTEYAVMESEGQVEVCVNLIHSSDDILDFTVHVEAYNQSSVYIPSEAVLASELSLYTCSCG